MTVARTSLEAYQLLQARGRERCQYGRILAAVIAHPKGLTRRELAIYTGFEPGAVAGRVAALLDDELVREDGTKSDPHTRVRAKVVKPIAVTAVGQADMFQ